MAGLFGVDTPEDIRARIGKTGQEQGLQLAQLPRGRGGVALAGQLGAGISQGAAQLLGAESPAQKQAKKNTLIEESIKGTASKMGITKDDDPVKYLGLSARILAENGELTAASNALKMGSTIDQLTNSEPTALERNVRQVFNLGKREQLTPPAQKLMSQVLKLQSTPSAGVLPSDKGATRTDISKSSIFLESELGEEANLPVKEMPKPQRKAFKLAHAERVRNLKNENKQKGNPPLSDNDLNRQVLDEMEPFLDRGEGAVFGLFDGDVQFDTQGFEDSLLDQAINEGVQDETVGIGSL